MAGAEYSVAINRPAKDVFDFLADGEKSTQWRSGVVDISKIAGEGLGTTFRQRVRGPGGRPVPADYRITTYEPNNRLGFEAIVGPVRPKGMYELEGQNGSTRVRFALEAELRGLKKLLMGRAIQRAMDAEVKSLEQLKSVLESEGIMKTT